MNFTQSGGGFLALVASAFWLTITIYWVVVAWRAMRALEGIDDSLRERNPR